MPDTSPTLAGFVAFCRSQGMTAEIIPDDDPGFATALAFGEEWVPCLLRVVSCVLYTAAVYNWSASNLIQFQQDQAGQTYFATFRAKCNEFDFVPGVVSSTSDESTATTLTVGKQLSNMGMIELQKAKDPFGRQALAIIGALGPNPWGLS